MSKCQMCRDNIPHSHLEVLQRIPPRTKDGEFLTVGLSGDVSFASHADFAKILWYCEKWNDRTFLIQSKNPAYFLSFNIPDNVILGTTIESNNWYINISNAPTPACRFDAMKELNCRKAVTIEPVLDFDIDVLVKWIKYIAPRFVYVGYANDRHEGKKLKLPEPPLAKTQELIARLQESGLEVRCKTIRRAWWE